MKGEMKMAATMKVTGKAMSIPGGMALSGIISTGMTLITSISIAIMLNKEQISWEQAGYWILAMLFLSAFLGGKGAIIAIKRQKLAVSCMAGILYWGILLIVTALFFGGNYEAVPETAGIIIAGSGCAAMVSLPQKRGKKAMIRK